MTARMPPPQYDGGIDRSESPSCVLHRPFSLNQQRGRRRCYPCRTCYSSRGLHPGRQHLGPMMPTFSLCRPHLAERGLTPRTAPPPTKTRLRVMQDIHKRCCVLLALKRPFIATVDGSSPRLLLYASLKHNDNADADALVSTRACGPCLEVTVRGPFPNSWHPA